MSELRNSYLLRLSSTDRALLKSALDALNQDAVSWCEMLCKLYPARVSGPDRRSHLQSAWQKGNNILVLLTLVNQMLYSSIDALDSDDLPNHYDAKALLGPENEFTNVGSDLIKRWKDYTADDWAAESELNRGLSDLVEEFQRVLGHVIPALHRSHEQASDGVDRDGCTIMEASRCVEHLIYHVEKDILEDLGRRIETSATEGGN